MLSMANSLAAVFLRLPVLMIVALALAVPAGAVSLWMTEAAVRGELIDAPMAGNYADGRPWQETYFPDGNIDYSDSSNNWKGRWSFRGAAFCTFYNGGLDGGCWQVMKRSANCYEFYAASRSGRPEVLPPGSGRSRTAYGWRKSEPSTCEPRVGV